MEQSDKKSVKYMLELMEYCGQHTIYNVPICPNCNEATYSEPKCPFCHTELEYDYVM